MSRLQGVSTTENLPAYSNCASAWNELRRLGLFGRVHHGHRSGSAVGGIPYQSTLKDGSNYILAGYHYSATQNNGPITSIDDGRQVNSVTYQYDLLKRLVSATAGSNWTQTFGYDGFGNLTSKSTPSGSSELPLPGVKAAKNWLTGYTYDANGNVASYSNFALAYDSANRLSSATTGSFVETYGYDASNHRIERVNSALDTVYFFSPSGALLSEFNCLSTCTLIYNRIYFGGMVLGTDGTTVNGTALSALGDSFTWTDRAGSAQSTYPYGADIGSYPAGADAVDFATYTKEGSTGLEYAMNRYYSGGFGRFMTIDPRGDSAEPTNPQSWNRYSYSGSDPANLFDPAGSHYCTPIPGDFGDSGACAAIAFGSVMVVMDTTMDPEGDMTSEGQGFIQSGGSTNPASRGGLTPEDLHKLLKYKINDLGPGCKRALPSQKTLLTKADNLVFWNGSSSGMGGVQISMLLPDIAPYNHQSSANNSTLGSIVGDNNAVTLWGPNGSISNDVDLGNNFYSSNPSKQQTTLLHELLHYATQFDDDNRFVQQYGIQPAPYESSSAAISDWINHDCPKSKN